MGLTQTNKPKYVTRKFILWRDAFVTEGIALGVNADVVDSVLRELERKSLWSNLIHSDPKAKARAAFDHTI